MVRRVLAVILIPLLLAGCAVADLAGALQSNARIKEHGELVRQKRDADALALMRSEIASPGVKLGTYQAAVRSLAIDDLTKIMVAEGKTGLLADPKADAEVLGWFSEGLGFAGSDATMRSTMFTGYANYLALTGRPGSSIGYRFLGLDLIREKDPVTAVKLMHQLVESAALSGNTELKNGLGVLFTQELANVSKRNDVPLDKQIELMLSDLGPSIDTIALDTPESVDGYWRGFSAFERECAGKCPSAMALLRLSFARAYAHRGAPGRARAFRDAAVREAAGEPAGSDTRKVVDVTGTCLETEILLAENQPAAVPAAYARCESAQAQAGGEEKLGLDGFFPNFATDQKLALAQALAASGRAGDAVARYRELIADLEGARATFDESQLTGFFTNPRARRAYEGLLRAELAAAGPRISRTSLARIINAAELFRARQLREMQARRAGRDRRSVVEQTLAYIRSPQATGSQLGAIPAGTMLVYTISLENELIVIAADARRHEVRRTPVGRAQLKAMVDAVAGPLADGSDLPGLDRGLREISRVTLVPVAAMLRGSRNLVVVPDGDLNRVPFSTLCLSAGGDQPLVESHGIVVLPALDLMGTPQAAGGGDSFIGVGDPIYPNAQQALGLTRAAITQINPGYQRSGDVIFPPLPETRTEIEAIAANFAPDRRRVLLGTDAVETRFKAEPLDRYRFVHLATHGVLGGDLPGLDEPALVLGAEPGQDGLLKASDITLLRLNADLAVLSACQTGSGKYVQGEGVLGMGRAFLVAGSRAVVVSLWPVNSVATEELMVALYRAMEGGQPPQAALRQAMLEIRAKNPHPSFWAPFILIGSPARGSPGA